MKNILPLIKIAGSCWEYDLSLCTNCNYNVWIKHDVLCSQVIFVNECDHLSLLRLKLIHVKWSGHWQQLVFQISTWMHTRIFTCQDSTTPFDELFSYVTSEHAIGLKKILKVWCTYPIYIYTHNVCSWRPIRTRLSNDLKECTSTQNILDTFT